MKKYINSLESEELSSIINNLNNFKFNENIQNLISSETEKNIKLFINNLMFFSVSDDIRFCIFSLNLKLFKLFIIDDNSSDSKLFIYFFI